MNGGHIMVVLIVAIVMIASVLRARYGHNRARVDGSSVKLHGPAAQNDPEKQQLLEEVRSLKKRVETLERITVEKENSLAREIEDLRSRP
jgi:uncharacterized protein YlxW (UPF0749 family)